MPPLTTLRALFVHNDWARDRLLEAAAPLDDERLDRRLEMGPGSLRAVLRHLWSAERFWLDWWKQQPGTDVHPRDERPTVDEIRRRLDALAAERTAFLDEAGPAGESRSIEALRGRARRYPLGDMMLHVCDHGVHHRAQASNMLRRLGVEPPRLDYLFMAMVDPPDVDVDRETVLERFRYGDWANERVAVMADGLDDDELDRPFEMGLGTLRRTLLHVRDAEQGMLDRWRGTPADDIVTLPDTTTLDELRTQAARTIAARNAYIAGVDDAELARFVTIERPGVTLRFRIGDALLQLGGHGTHHRAQAVNMLRHLGVELRGFDYIDWLDRS